MILAILSCGHRLHCDSYNEEGNMPTSDYCPKCGLWVGIKSFEEVAWPNA